MDDTDLTDWPESSLGKKFQDLERNFRCLICRDIYENPQILNCGHTYCSLCIRRHLDHALNSNNSDRCPDCKERSEISHLKPNLNIASAILAYKVLRPEMLDEMSAVGERAVCSSSVSVRTRVKRERDEKLRKLPHLSFHGKSKKYVKDAIERLCSSSNVRPCVDGDQSELERFYRDIVHLNNAQIDSRDPLSFDEIIKESTKRYVAVKKEAKANPASRILAEKMKNGEIPKAAIDSYISLIQKVRADSLKLKQSAPSLRNSSENSGSISTGHEEMNEISEDAEPGEYTEGVWRIMMSDKLGRPFFYNTRTKIGQFTIPEELSKDGLESDGTTSDAQRGEPEARDISPAAISEVHDLSVSDASEAEVAPTGSRKRPHTESKRRKSNQLLKSKSPKELQRNQSEEVKDNSEVCGSVVEHDISNEETSDFVHVHCEEGVESVNDSNLDGCRDRGTDLKTRPDSIFEEWNGEEDLDDDVSEVMSRGNKRRVYDDANTSGVRSNLDEISADAARFLEDNDSSRSCRGSPKQVPPGPIVCKWNCPRCTYQNEENDYSCTMCGQSNGSQQPRRSQRDSIAQSGSIMRGFALALSQQGLPTDSGVSASSRAATRLSSSATAASHRDTLSAKSQTSSTRRR